MTIVSINFKIKARKGVEIIKGGMQMAKDKTTKRKPQQRTIESREKINQAAWKLFCEKGYYNTNTKEIAKCAGISVGNFYNYYKDKGEVYYELLQQYIQGTLDGMSELSRTMIQEKDSRGAFAEYVQMQLGREDDTGRLFDDCTAIIADSEELQEMFAQCNQKMCEMVEYTLRNTEGVVQRGDYGVMARMLFQMVDMISRDVVATRGTDLFEEYTRQLVNVVVNYIFGETIAK